MTTVSQAVANREQGPGALVERYAESFQQVLPTHIKPETFVRLAQGILRRDDKLLAAATSNPTSLFAALLECARLGHEPGTDAFALVPIGGAVEGWEQYQGVIERMYRAGAVRSVKAEVVRANDDYRYDRDTMRVPRHRFDDFADEAERGPFRGVYAYAEMIDGSFSRVVTMSKQTVMKHKAMSKNAGSSDSPWKKWEETMWLKCGVHELEKWVPTSSEYRREQFRAAAEVSRPDLLATPRSVPYPGHDYSEPVVNPATGEVLEGEVDGDWEDPRLDAEPTGQSALAAAQAAAKEEK